MYQVGLFPVSRRNTVAAYAGISRCALDFNISAVSSLVLSPLYTPCNSVSPLRGLAVRCDALRVSVCGARGTGPPRLRDAAQHRGDRDAKGTRAAFKLAAAKRINSPGSLDLLIRAAVAFLRGLDR